MQNKLLLLLLCTSLVKVGTSQLVVTPEPDDEVFIYSLAGPGIVVSDIVRNCAVDASGFFNGTDANVGIENGIMLTSGFLSNAMGPNNMGSTSGYNGTAGDPELDLLTDWLTYDACIIEFDMTVMADTLKLNYVFGSEEYPEYVLTSFNDVFAFWVSGPDILTPVNIATVPGTALPVTINNINEFVNPDFYVPNGDGFEAPYSTDDYYVQYDGITTVLLATIPVTAGETYHMKMAIADAGDAILDSGVFLETGSLGSLRMHHDTFADNGLSFAVEKCANGYFKLVNEVPCAEPLVIDYMIAGSAVNGVDYELIAEQITIPAWDSIGMINIIPIHDAVDESAESVILYLYNPQSGFVYDTLTMLIDDEPASASFEAEVSDHTVAFAETSGSAVSVLWDFGDGTTSTETAPVHTYADDGYYMVCVSIINAYGCADEYCSEVLVGTVGIHQLTEQLMISPNPASTTISLQDIPAGSMITIRTLQGAEIMQILAAGQTEVISVASIPAGLYMIEVQQEGKISTAMFEKL